MIDTALPVGIRVSIGEVIVVAVILFRKKASCHNRLAIYGIYTGHIQGNRIKGGKHADIGNNRSVVLSMAVAVGGYIYHQADMEAWAIL